MSRALCSFVSLCSFVFSIAFAGCLFSTRTPEPPSSSNTFIWTPATTPEFLLQDFTGTLKILDAPDYMRVFINPSDSGSGTSKSFSFIPAPNLDQASRAIFTNWNVQSEGAWLAKLSSLLPVSSQLSVTLSNTVTSQSSASAASISANYTISIPSSSSSSLLPSLVQGSFQMELAFVTTDQGTTEWRIVSWTDFPQQNGTIPAWTDLKVKLSS
jgi:hypothetical protein